jgi:hypothetical protein
MLEAILPVPGIGQLTGRIIHFVLIPLVSKLRMCSVEAHDMAYLGVSDGKRDVSAVTFCAGDGYSGPNNVAVGWDLELQKHGKGCGDCGRGRGRRGRIHWSIRRRELSLLGRYKDGPPVLLPGMLPIVRRVSGLHCVFFS